VSGTGEGARSPFFWAAIEAGGIAAQVVSAHVIEMPVCINPGIGLSLTHALASGVALIL
jgi:hypothetical protein